MPCSSHIDACSTSMSYETNLLKENNKLSEQVKKLSNKLERCYNSQVTFEHMLKSQRNFSDESGVGFKASKVNHQESRNDIVALASTRARSRIKDGAREDMKER